VGVNRQDGGRNGEIMLRYISIADIRSLVDLRPVGSGVIACASRQ
jgi:hypothetical protein